MMEYKKQNKFDECIGERVKLRRQKFDELNNLLTEKDKITNKELLKKYFKF